VSGGFQSVASCEVSDTTGAAISTIVSTIGLAPLLQWDERVVARRLQHSGE